MFPDFVDLNVEISKSYYATFLPHSFSNSSEHGESGYLSPEINEAANSTQDSVCLYFPFMTPIIWSDSMLVISFRFEQFIFTLQKILHRVSMFQCFIRCTTTTITASTSRCGIVLEAPSEVRAALKVTVPWMK